MIQKKNESKQGLGDFLDILFDEMGKDGAVLDIDRAINLIFTFFILAQETTPGILAATVKLVADHPDVMEELKVFFFTLESFYFFISHECLPTKPFQREHEAVVQNRGDKEAGVTWEEYKSMTFTHMVGFFAYTHCLHST